MKKLFHKILLFIFTFLFLFLSCKNKEEILPPVKYPPQGYTQYGTPFSNIPNTEDLVMYEVNLLAFSEEGNLEGVIARLDEIKALGVNVIWLMPVHPIGEINSVNSPYSVKNYTAIHPQLGTLADLRQLIEEAHQLNMAVILDWVANHTAWDHPWITNTSWYTQNVNGEIIHPAGTNWEDVADLNFDNPEMLQTYQNFMEIYTTSAVARVTDLEEYPHAQVVCFKKELNGEKLLVIVNIRNSTVNYSIPSTLQNTTWTNAIEGTNISLGTLLQLESFEYLILKQ